MKKIFFIFVVFLFAACNKDTTTDTTSTTPVTTAPLITVGAPYNVTYHSADLTWSAYTKTDFKQYEVYRSVISGFTPDETTLATTITNKNTTTYSIDGLTDNTRYFFKIRLVKKTGTPFDTDERSALTWVVMYNQFTDGDGLGFDSLFYNRDSSDIVTPQDTADMLIATDYSFNDMNLLHFNEIKVEYKMKSRAFLFPAMTNVSAGIYYTTPNDTTLPISNTSVRKISYRIFDFQMPLSPEDVVIGIHEEVGGYNPSYYVLIYEPVISGVRADGMPFTFPNGTGHLSSAKKAHTGRTLALHGKSKHSSHGLSNR